MLAAGIVKNLKSKPNNDDLLLLYGLFKQATIGDNNNNAPGFMDFKGKEKHKAWLKNKGMNTYDSEVIYITKVNELITKYGVNQ